MLTVLITMSTVNNIKKMITYFKEKNHKSKKNKIFKTFNTILESVDTIVIIGATPTSITLSVIGIGLIVLPISAGLACSLSLGNKVLLKLIMNNCNKNKEQYEKDQQTINPFDEIYRKPSQDNVIDKTEYGSLCNIFTNSLEETKNESFLKNE